MNSEDLKQKCLTAGIDWELTNQLLEKVNAKSISPQVFEPVVHHPDLMSLDQGIDLEEKQKNVLLHTFPQISRLPYLQTKDPLHLDSEKLVEIGTLLYPTYSYGILNGGSASSYADTTKNHSYSPELYAIYEELFKTYAPRLQGLPKALAPAWYTPKAPGPTFLELKFRMIKTMYERYEQITHKYNIPVQGHPAPLFQMLNTKNASHIRKAQQDILKTEFCTSSVWEGSIYEAEQALIAAITHEKLGYPRRVFQSAFGNSGEPYGLPGGHGQQFHVLRNIYKELYAQGIHFVSIGNIDNLGYTIDPRIIAYLACTSVCSIYEFSPRTALDKKGGILVTDEHGRLTCADIGVSIDPSSISQIEPTYFNCANGWFRLSALLEKLEDIIENLPLRISNQSKDAGDYAQIEMITWEAMPYTQPLKVLCVKKKDRLLSAKMILETFILSNIHLERVTSIFPYAAELGSSISQLLNTQYNTSLDELFTEKHKHHETP